MSESNAETSVQREERLGLLNTRFISLLQDAKDSLLDLKMGADILSVVLEGNSCNTREKTEILKLKEELQDSKNKEIEIDLNYALEEQEDDCQDVGGKAQENDEAMEEVDLDDNNKTRSWYHDNVKTKKISALKTEASLKERPIVRGRGGEKEKVSSESISAASVSKAKDDVSEEEENEKEVTEKTITRSRSRILTLNQQTNEATSQDTENHPVNNRVNSRVNIQAKAPLEYHGQDTLGKHEESELPYVTGTENHKITASKKLFPRGKKVYGCPYECGFVCIPGRRFEVTRHLNSNIMFGTLRKPSCPVRRKMEVVCRDGIWPKSIKKPVFLGLAVTGRGGEKDKDSTESTAPASIFRAKDDHSSDEENEKEVQEKTKTRGRGKIETINQQNNEARRQDTENHPDNNQVNIRVSIKDKVFFEYLDIIEDVLQSLDKLCSLPSRRDYFFQLEKSKGAVDLFEITDPNIGPEKFDGPNVTDNFARPRIICRPQFEAFLRREICGAGKEAAKEAKRKYRCPYCFMLALSRDVIVYHIQSRKRNGEWIRPPCLARRHKEPNPSGIYESKWPDPKRAPIIEIDCNDILIWIYSQLNIRIPINCLREKNGSKFVRLNI
ncbi:uncharacterized protein LOC107371990 [Tetranychus urticae]|uniref:uncharacterized protein LOC107371990 n=1 Tax=Tetranychus urticae TaxID=32264 RepID=UPI000D645A23|nr:uncharacterized protein LOC107371990 [Tetranychus urticae]XP_025015957.1 uncharacterized protein LOC107371990 [Tetranychus urticae]